MALRAACQAGKVQMLIATDVAARGLHVKNLPIVINFDFPPTLEQYVHRVGRTGRQGKPGYSYSFFTRNLAALAPDLIGILTESKQKVPFPLAL